MKGRGRGKWGIDVCYVSVCPFLKHRKPLHFVTYSFKPVIHYSHVIYYLQDIHSTKGPLISGRAVTFLKRVSHTFPTEVSSMCTLT